MKTWAFRGPTRRNPKIVLIDDGWSDSDFSPDEPLGNVASLRERGGGYAAAIKEKTRTI